eukprot:TRINITY_DN1893_c0_g1_i2.p1 TRINITY_DN1893_c0_g1~~TRINITY_DN1893_c0_g1_i2.p1  ORF type:complete len:384 (-),score=78.80 TRINITY_DN1893_c0_g1_i2:25-1176(-)
MNGDEKRFSAFPDRFPLEAGSNPVVPRAAAFITVQKKQNTQKTRTEQHRQEYGQHGTAQDASIGIDMGNENEQNAEHTREQMRGDSHTRHHKEKNESDECDECDEGELQTVGLIASSSGISIWDLHSRRNDPIESPHADIVSSCSSFCENRTPGPARVVSSSLDGIIALWDTRDFSFKHFDAGNPVETLETLGSDHFIFGQTSGEICQFDVERMAVTSILKAHEKSVRSISYSQEHHLLVSGSEDGLVRVWADGSSVSTVSLPHHKNVVTSVLSIPNSEMFVSGSRDKTIIVYDWRTFQPLFTFPDHGDSITRICARNNLLLSGSRDRTIKKWNLATGQKVLSIDGAHDHWVSMISFVPDSLGFPQPSFISGGVDNELTLWMA